MSSIPGAFPDVQPSSSAPASPMPLGASAELISVRRALQSRRSLFKKDLNQKMALLCGVYVVIVYLYDCSFMLLLLHGLVYWHLVTPYVWDQIPLSKDLIRLSTLQGIVMSNLLSTWLHFSRDIPSPDTSGFIYGHHSVQVIGQRQITSKTYLYILDFIIFLVQTIMYAITFHSHSGEVDSKTIAMDYDGSGGNAVVLHINLLNSILNEHMSIESLQHADEVDSERLQRFRESLLGVDNAIYGSMDNE